MVLLNKYYCHFQNPPQQSITIIIKSFLRPKNTKMETIKSSSGSGGGGDRDGDRGRVGDWLRVHSEDTEDVPGLGRPETGIGVTKMVRGSAEASEEREAGYDVTDGPVVTVGLETLVYRHCADNGQGKPSSEDSESKYRTRNAVRCVIGGILVHLVLGNLYTWGIITTAVTAHLRQFDSSLEYGDTLSVYITQLAFVGIFMSVGGAVQVRVGARYTCLLGGLLISLGAFLSAFVKSLIALCFTGGVLFGMGVGISYSAPIVCAAKWRPDKKSLIAGVILAGFGGGSFCFGFIDTYILHYGATKEDSEFVDGYFPSGSSIPKMVPVMYLMLSLLYTLASLVGCWLLREPPQINKIADGVGLVQFNPFRDEVTSAGDAETVHFSPLRNCVTDESVVCGTPPSGNSLFHRPHILKAKYDLVSTLEAHQVASPDDAFRSTNGCRQLTDNQNSLVKCDNVSDVGEIFGRETVKYVEMGPSELVRDSLGWHITSCYSLTAVAGIFITGTYKTFGLQNFHDDLYLSYLGSSASLFNVVGRITWGALADRIGPTTTLSYLSLAFSVLIFTYSSAPSIGGKITFSIWTYAIFAVEGGIFSLYLPQCIILFGPENAGKNYGVVFGGFSVCNVIIVVILSRLNVAFRTVSLILGSIVALGFFDLLLLIMHIYRRFKIRT
jgi:MFS family permease